MDGIIEDGATPEAAETPSSPEDTADDTIQPVEGDGEEGGEGEVTEADPWADYEDAEIGGKTYKVHKELKDSHLMHADYTRKTQEVAEARRSVEAAQKAHTEALKATEAYIEDLGELRVIDREIEQYSKVDWAALRAQHPELADQHWWQYQQLKDKRGNVATRITERQHAETSKAQRESAERQEKGFRELSSSIKGWGPDLAGKLVEFAHAEGLTDADVAAFENNPRVIKLVHKAWLAKGITEKAKAAAAAAQTKADSPPIEPVKQLTKARSGPPPSAGPSDSDPHDVWLRKREAQVAKRNRR